MLPACSCWMDGWLAAAHAMVCPASGRSTRLPPPRSQEIEALSHSAATGAAADPELRAAAAETLAAWAESSEPLQVGSCVQVRGSQGRAPRAAAGGGVQRGGMMGPQSVPACCLPAQ